MNAKFPASQNIAIVGIAGRFPGASNMDELWSFLSERGFAIGPVPALIAGGVGAIVTVALWSRIFPVLRTTKTFDPPDDLLEGKQQEHPQEA